MAASGDEDLNRRRLNTVSPLFHSRSPQFARTSSSKRGSARIEGSANENEDEEFGLEAQVSLLAGGVDRIMHHKMMKRAAAKVTRGQSSCSYRPVFIILCSIILSDSTASMRGRTDLAEIGGIGYWIAA